MLAEWTSSRQLVFARPVDHRSLLTPYLPTKDKAIAAEVRLGHLSRRLNANSISAISS